MFKCFQVKGHNARKRMISAGIHEQQTCKQEDVQEDIILELETTVADPLGEGVLWAALLPNIS